MRVLITGISGFIGGHLFHIAPKNCEVWGTHLNSFVQAYAPRSLRVDLCDPSALKTVITGIKPDIVIHTAAYSRVSSCENAPTAAWETNTLVTANLADLCAEKHTRLVFLSSDMVFDGTKGLYSEQDPPNPINFYGWTKLAAERRVSQQKGDFVIIRVNLTYGAPRTGGTSFSEEVIDTVRSGQPYYLYADQFRSFISVKNLAECVWEIAAGTYCGLIHLGGSEATDRVTFALKLAKRVGLNPNLLIPSSSTLPASSVGYPKNNTFDLSLASSLLKTPLLDLEAGLAREYPS